MAFKILASKLGLTLDQSLGDISSNLFSGLQSLKKKKPFGEYSDNVETIRIVFVFL